MAILSDYLEYEQPTKYIVNNDNYNNNYQIPVLTAGQSFILGYTDEKENIFSKEQLPIILFDDFTTSTQYVDFEFKVKSSAMKILHAKENVNIKFCYYLLKSIKFNSDTHKRYWISEFANRKVKEYDKATQDDIAKKIDIINEAIMVKRNIVEDYKKYLMSVFFELFGDINSNTKNFSVNALHEIAKISSSKRIYAKEYTESGIPFYRGTEISELSRGEIPKSPLFISNNRYNELKEKYGVPSKGDILITAVGTVGNTWVIDNDKPFYYKDGNVIQIHLLNKMSGIYFKYALDTLIEDFKFHNVNGTSYSALTIDKFKNMKIIIPPIELQKKFEDIYKNIDVLCKITSDEINDLQALLNSKIEEYFN